MAHVAFSPSAPCAFLIVQDGADICDESRTVLVQSDWDWPAIAQRMQWDMRAVQVQGSGYYGFNPCDHDGTDGTVACPDCNLTAAAFIGAAHDHIREHAGESFTGLDDYFAE